MTKEELIKLLRENLWTANDQDIMGSIDSVAEKIAIRFIVMEVEIERLRKANSDMGWRLNPDRMGGGWR